jgi:SAM-dependent methyltransferase
VRELDPYAFLAVLGKRVIHPGGRASTERLLAWADVRPGERVLDIGAGVGTTAIRLAREHGAQVVAADISAMMRERAVANVAAAGLGDQVRVEDADILDLPYSDGAFDVVVAEAVTMFVDRPRAAAELARVTRPGGRVLATEFCWRRPPTPEARQVFLGEVCPGLRFDSVQEWAGIYADAGLVDIIDGVRTVRDDDRAWVPGRRGRARGSGAGPRHVTPGLRAEDGVADAADGSRCSLSRLRAGDGL